MAVPLLTRALGRRRGWAIAIEAGAGGWRSWRSALLDPAHASLVRRLALAALVAFLSASQDIVIDAYRVELLDEREQGAGAAATQVGYRIGMVASAAGALYLAAYFGWFWSYVAMAALIWRRHAERADDARAERRGRPPAKPGSKARSSRPSPSSLRARPGSPSWSSSCSTNSATRSPAWMSNPFYIALGFSKIEIANVAKVFGAGASVAGVFAGRIAWSIASA